MPNKKGNKKRPFADGTGAGKTKPFRRHRNGVIGKSESPEVPEDTSKISVKAKIKPVGLNLLLILLGALLFAFSFPSFLDVRGWAPLAFICLIPIIPVIHRSTWKGIWFYGLLYGFLSYALFNFWLAKFHPLSIFIVPNIYAFYFMVFFPLLKAVDSWFPRFGYIPQVILWIGYEYLRTQGFLAYPYGNLAYSQYLFIPFIQIASVTGIWGVSALIAFPSFYFGAALREGIGAVKGFIANHKLPLLVYCFVVAGTLFYGFTIPGSYDDYPSWKTGLIQQNMDPWKSEYDLALETHIELSDKALSHNPDIIIWSETSFVPGIYWHNRFRTDPERWLLVSQLLDYLQDKTTPFVIGNDDRRFVPTGGTGEVDYNATILFENGEIQDIYRKVHLVPFTEHFPYEEIFPGVYKALKEADTHFWEKGTEFTVFQAGGVRFSTPICFEDVFGYISREFVRNGAQVIANVTNDAWSFSVAAEMQHMAMSIFRAVENRRSLVRSTNAGITCGVLPNGKIIDQLEPFVADYLIVEVPVYDEVTTFYTRFGDWFGLSMLIFSLAILLSGLSFTILRKLKIDKKRHV